MKRIYLGTFFLLGMLFMLTACGEEKTTSQSNSAEESSSNKKEDSNTEDKVEAATQEKESENESKTEKVAETKPSNEEIKEIVQKSYQLLEAAKKNSEDNLAGDFDAFVADLEPYFTNSYIKNLPLEAFSVATSYNLPSHFDFDQHFEVTTNSVDQVVAEIYQTDEMNGPVIYIVTAKKEDGQWKIDDFTYEEVTEEAAGATTSSNISSGSTELLDEAAVEEIAYNYFGGHDGVIVDSMSLLDENTYRVEVYTYASEEHYNYNPIDVNRHTREVSVVDRTQ